MVLSPRLPLPTLAFYGVWIMVLQLLWFSTVPLFFTHTAIRARFLAVGHWIDRIFGVAMVALGMRVLISDHR
jgi:threonine/homoserine/homoserine lactone efflux protein